jgi:hypothetical protein
VPLTSTGCTEAADAGEHLGPLRRADDALDVVDQRVTLVDVDSGIAIRQARLLAHGLGFTVSELVLEWCWPARFSRAGPRLSF